VECADGARPVACIGLHLHAVAARIGQPVVLFGHSWDIAAAPLRAARDRSSNLIIGKLCWATTMSKC
jgi:hypothetical protein